MAQRGQLTVMVVRMRNEDEPSQSSGGDGAQT